MTKCATCAYLEDGVCTAPTPRPHWREFNGEYLDRTCPGHRPAADNEQEEQP